MPSHSRTVSLMPKGVEHSTGVEHSIALRDYQQAAADAIRGAYQRQCRAPLLVSPTGSGKCLAPGTPILMFDGSIKAVEEVRVGDLLMGPDSTPRQVMSLASGQEAMYRIVPKKGDPYTVNESHILSLRMTPSNKLGFADNAVVNLSVREYLGQSKTFKHCAKTWRAGVDFPETDGINADLDPYLLGIWLAEGTVGKPIMTTAEPEILAYFHGIAAQLGLRVRAENGRNCKTVHLVLERKQTGRGHHHNRLTNALRDVGVLLSKHVPHAYRTASRANRLALLAGYLDGDGFLSNGVFDAICRERRLANDIAFVARSLGFGAKVTPCTKRINRIGFEGTYFRLSICGDLSEIPVIVPRRKASPRAQKKNVLVSGFKVEPVGIGSYYGFEIAGADRLFMLGDFTVTHNTVLFSYIAANAALKGNRTLVLVHRRELLKQTSRTLAQFGVAHGLISAGISNLGRDLVQVASVQTLVKRMAIMRWRPDLIVVDEAHHATGKTTWGKVLAHFSEAKVLGVTATPERLDSQGLGVEAGGFFDALVLGPSVAELTERGFLSPAVVYAPRAQVDLSGVHSRGGDWAVGELSEVLDRQSITGDAVSHYRKHCHGEPAIAFCVSIKHAEHVAEAFRAAGYTAASVDGAMDYGERASRIENLGNGRLQVLTSCDIISEGTDVPIVSAAILLRPTQSLSLSLQQMGRVLRPFPGKQRAIILDHVGNTFRHGLPDDERDWSLAGRPKKARQTSPDEFPVRQCEECYTVHRPAPRCPNCGFLYPTSERAIEVVDGELERVEPSEARRIAREEQAHAKTFEDLVELGRRRGYAKPRAWAKHVMAARGRRVA